MHRPPGRILPVLAAAALAVAAISGCSATGRVSYHGSSANWTWVGGLLAAIARAPAAFFEFVESGAYEVVRPGADFEEWRMRYSHRRDRIRPAQAASQANTSSQFIARPGSRDCTHFTLPTPSADLPTTTVPRCATFSSGQYRP